MMSEKKYSRLGREWDDHWKQVQKSGGLTWLGKRMTAAKRRKVEGLVKGLDASTALDVGCGLGHLCLAMQAAGLDVLGIDSSPTAVAMCRAKGLNVRQAHLEEMEDAFDLVASDGLLEHELDFAPTAGHMMRLSRSRVLLIQPNHESITGRSLAFAAGILGGPSRVHEYNYRLADFIEVFERGGFLLDHSLPVFGNVFRILLFKRKRAEEAD